jgi:hypothetical protein
VLPPWTNRIDVWPEESRDSIQLAGDFSVGEARSGASPSLPPKSHFSYTNRVWNVSGLRVAGPAARWTWIILERFDGRLSFSI